MCKLYFKTFLAILAFFIISFTNGNSAEKVKLLKQDWSFKGITGKFDRAALQRGYQVYTEVCASCHSMRLLSYRNLGEEGGPEFSVEQVKAIAANFEIEDGPNEEGEMFMRPGRPSDKFVSPYKNIQAAKAANGGAYPPDLSVMVKARHGGADYIYSLLLGYVDAPNDVKLDDGVYYNEYAKGQKIAMPQVLYEDGVEYTDGTIATQEQMSRDVTMFLTWAAEPKLEARKRIGFKVISYLLILSVLLYFTNRQIWKES